jgi:hypothetical protein
MSQVTGSLVLAITDADFAADANVARSRSAERSLLSYPVDMLDARVWDALHTLLPATGGTDDLGLYTNAVFGTLSARIKTGDVKAAGAVTRRARWLLPIPALFVDANSVQIRALAGMETTVADTSATVDFEAHLLQADGTVSADLVTTAAASINSLTLANKDFDLTSASLVPGSVLDVRMTVVTNDAASVTAVIAAVAALSLRCDSKP